MRKVSLLPWNFQINIYIYIFGGPILFFWRVQRDSFERGAGGREDLWDRTNERPKKTAPDGADRQVNHPHTDLATLWLNRPSGAYSVKIASLSHWLLKKEVKQKYKNSNRICLYHFMHVKARRTFVFLCLYYTRKDAEKMGPGWDRKENLWNTINLQHFR